MSADVWFKRDIANALLATYQATRETQAATGAMDPHFNAGLRTAISTLALYFGIAPALVLPAPGPMTAAPDRLRLDTGH